MATERIGVRVCDGPNCNAKILDAITINGAKQPFDVEPGDGNTILIKRREGPPLALQTTKLPDEYKVKLREQGVAFYTPHHATCVDVEQFKKKP